MGNALAAKLAKIGREVAYVQKDKTINFGNEGGRRAGYASAEKVLGKINEAVFERGISISTEIRSIDTLALVDNKGRPYNLSTMVLRVTFTDSDTGEQLSAEGVGQGADASDKSAMKAFTAAHKYAYAGAFCISWGDDPEATTVYKDDKEEVPEEKVAQKPGPKAKPVDTTEYPGHAVLEALAEEMKTANLNGLDKLPPADYASLVEGWKQRIVACKPSSTEAKYRETVKLYKGFVGEKTNG